MKCQMRSCQWLPVILRIKLAKERWTFASLTGLRPAALLHTTVWTHTHPSSHAPPRTPDPGLQRCPRELLVHIQFFLPRSSPRLSLLVPFYLAGYSHLLKQLLESYSEEFCISGQDLVEILTVMRGPIVGSQGGHAELILSGP